MNNIKPIDYKVLEFRDELIKLCNKYKCELSGSNFDDGNINLEIYDKNNDVYEYYIMKNYHDNYNLYQETENLYSCIMEKVIEKFFNQDSGVMAGLNNIKVSCGILTNDPYKAEHKIEQLYQDIDKSLIDTYTNSKGQKELRLLDGRRYVWIQLKQNSKGYRCGSIILDKNITLKELQELVDPMCYACGRNDVEIF